MQISYEVDGMKQLSRNLRVLVSKLSNMKEFHQEAVNIIRKRSDDIFANSGKNVKKGSARSSLAPSTEKARSRGRGYYKTAPNKPGVLRWTGRLQSSKKLVSNNQFGSLEFTAPYAKFHQRGGKNLPSRPLIDLDNATNSEIVRAMQKKVQRDLGVFGLQA